MLPLLPCFAAVEFGSHLHTLVDTVRHWTHGLKLTGRMGTRTALERVMYGWKCQHAEKPASGGTSGQETTKPGTAQHVLACCHGGGYILSGPKRVGSGKEERGTLTGVLFYVEVLGEERAQRLHSAPREAHEMGGPHWDGGWGTRRNCRVPCWWRVGRDCRGTGGVEKAYAKRKCGYLAGGAGAARVKRSAGAAQSSERTVRRRGRGWWNGERGPGTVWVAETSHSST